MPQENSARKPFNADDDTSIFNAQSNTYPTQPSSANSINPTSARYDTQPHDSPTAPNRTYTPPQNTKPNPTNGRQAQHHQPQGLNKTNNHSNGLNSGSTPRQLSPTRSNNNVPEGYRIAKRELWWKEPPRREEKFVLNDKHKVDHVGPRVDCYNPEYNPKKENSKLIESHRLEWNANHAVETWANFKHEPQGGNRRYPSENLQWNALPKVDSGFIYTFE